jgi:hypothetical protein
MPSLVVVRVLLLLPVTHHRGRFFFLSFWMRVSLISSDILSVQRIIGIFVILVYFFIQKSTIRVYVMIFFWSAIRVFLPAEILHRTVHVIWETDENNPS